MNLGSVHRDLLLDRAAVHQDHRPEPVRHARCRDRSGPDPAEHSHLVAREARLHFEKLSVRFAVPAAQPRVAGHFVTDQNDPVAIPNTK